MSPEILLVVAGLEAGIVIGAGFTAARRWLRDGRHMVLHAVNSLHSPIA